LFNGKCQLILQAGTTPDKLKLEATSEGLWKAGTEIHSIKPIYPTKPMDVVISPAVKPGITERIGKILGADISFLPQLEHKGIKFQDNGEEKDAIQILKDHGFNYIRLRVFVDPAHAKGYSPNEGFCDLNHTLAMAKRVKDTGLKLLLDFHYSDYWADPQQQFKPNAWEGMQMPQLSQALKDYTHMVIRELAEQGTTPDMVQVGNEINHGMVWPEGHIGNADNLATLLKAGIEGVKKADPNILIMLHVALGGQHDESVFWFDNMFSRGVDCDLIGLSYYPRWHGTLGDLRYNMNLLIQRYHKPINVVEYSHMKTEVNQEAFTLPDDMGTGTFIWEPLNTWDQVFDKDGRPNSKLMIYDELAKKFLPSSK
jgi:beta-galactosidase